VALREKVEHPKHLRRAEKRVKKLQRELSRKQKGSKNYEKARQKLAKLHAYISNARNDFLHKLSKAIIDENQVVVVEDINVKRLMQSNLAKSISDSNWSKLLTYLRYKVDVNASINLYLVGLERSEVKPVELWWMTVSLMGYLKSHHALKQEAPPSTRWSSSPKPYCIILFTK